MKEKRSKSLSSHATCSPDQEAVREMLTKIGDKWSIFLIACFSQTPGSRARFSTLEKMIPGISQRMLTLTLRNLERDGMITREVFPEVPPRVEYELTKLGKSLLEPMKSLIEWVVINWSDVRKAREKFDQKSF